MKDSFQGTTCILVRNYIICFRVCLNLELLRVLKIPLKK